MNQIIERPTYFNQLKRLKDKQIIKVISGIRRSGKSTMFTIFCDYLKTCGVSDEQIIRMNLEDPKYSDIEDGLSLYQIIKKQLRFEHPYYIFLDEVQTVPQFQKAVNGLFLIENCDIYITGSNAFLLSGELATLLSGRYIEIKMMPLSFKEFVSAFPDEQNLRNLYIRYIQNSSFPYALQLNDQDDIHAYLDGIYTSILLKDILARFQITDTDSLERMIRLMFDNIGNLCSATKIANTLTSSGKKISIVTVERYLQALLSAFVLYKADRYDVKGKNLLTTGNKYYVADIGLRYYLLGTKYVDMGHILENIVYLELRRRNYEVHIGKVGTTEIDFIAIGKKGTEYYQVAYTVIDGDGSTLKRELAPFAHISDHHAKYLLTMDETPFTSHNGIQQINVFDWLLE